MMKNRIILIIVLVAAFSAGLAMRAFMRQPQLVDIEHALKSVLARNGVPSATIEGNPAFQILPSPELILSNAKLTSDNGLSISAARIVLGFNFLSLVTGEYRISSISIVDSEATLPNVTPLPDTHAAEGLLIAFVNFFDRERDKIADDSIDTVTISNGRLHYGQTSNDLTLSVATALFERSFDGTLSASANLSSGEQSVTLELVFAKNENGSALGRKTSFSIRNDDLMLSGKGATVFDSNLQFLGDVSFNAKNLEALNHILPTPITALPQVGASLKAKARFSFSAVTLSDMRFSVGKSNISGNVIADFIPSTPRLTGTLAATTLDLTDFLAKIGMKRDQLGNWSHDQLPANIVPDVDVDMRLSAEALTIQDATINSVALSSLIRNRKAELTLVSANLFDGSITGKIQISDDDHSHHYNIAALFGFDAIDLEKAGIALLDSKRLSGITTGRIALNTVGASSADMINGLSGDIEIAIENNAIVGLDLISFLHRVESRPLGAVLSIKSGTTVFNQGQITMKIENGVAQLETAKLTKYPDLQVRLNGKIDLARRNFAIIGHALGSSAIASDRSIDLPFSLQGPFDSPDFIPDFTNVAKQSGTIAP